LRHIQDNCGSHGQAVRNHRCEERGLGQPCERAAGGPGCYCAAGSDGTDCAVPRSCTPAPTGSKPPKTGPIVETPPSESVVVDSPGQRLGVGAGGLAGTDDDGGGAGMAILVLCSLLALLLVAVAVASGVCSPSPAVGACGHHKRTLPAASDAETPAEEGAGAEADPARLADLLDDSVSAATGPLPAAAAAAAGHESCWSCWDCWRVLAGGASAPLGLERLKAADSPGR
jgi:hypothetical protein